MRLFSYSIMRGSTLLFIFFTLALQSYGSKHWRRAPPPPDDVDILEVSDGPTEDKSAGLGVEFEAHAIEFFAEGCNKCDTDACKKQIVGGRQSTNWDLTADTTLNIAGRLIAEYILKGDIIKIGRDAARAAAQAVAGDIIKWRPSKGDPLKIQGCDCDWTVSKPLTGSRVESIDWAMQVTAPMPLEAISDLFETAVTNKPPISKLLPTVRQEWNKVYVTPDFFQRPINGITKEVAQNRKDILGFFSLVLS